jgi:ATP-dependent Lhr-like helicase
MVSDPYRIILRAPYEIKKEYVNEHLKKIGDVRAQLERSLAYSHLMKLKFLHVGRLFGLFEEEATVGHRFIEALKNSVVYEETIREIFFRYFDVERTQEILDGIHSGKIKIENSEEKKISYFGKLGLEKFSGREYLGAFEPKEKIIEAFRTNANNKMLEMVCVNCGTERYIYLGGAPEHGFKCNKCGGASLSLKLKRKSEQEHAAKLIRNYGKKALIALCTYGIGPETAERILRKLHRKEEDFYLDLIEAQKLFVKNKKYWKVS